MPELAGEWNVRRTGGLLPPLHGVRKRFEGTSGATIIGTTALGVPFDVVGLELRYRMPFRGFVDVLTPDGERFRGRATFRGREFGRFELTRTDGNATL